MRSYERPYYRVKEDGRVCNRIVNWNLLHIVNVRVQLNDFHYLHHIHRDYLHVLAHPCNLRFDWALDTTIALDIRQYPTLLSSYLACRDSKSSKRVSESWHNLLDKGKCPTHDPPKNTIKQAQYSPWENAECSERWWFRAHRYREKTRELRNRIHNCIDPKNGRYSAEKREGCVCRWIARVRVTASHRWST